MDVFHPSNLKELTGQKAGKCLSIYLPAFVSGREVKQTPIRFRNLVNDGIEKWEKMGWKKQEIQTEIETILGWLDQPKSILYQAPGICLFISPGLLKSYRLPVHFEETVEVSTRFYFKPLLPLLYKDSSFNVLVLDLHNIKLFRGDNQNISEIEIPDVTTSFQDHLNLFEHEKQLQFHANTSQPGASNPGLIFHGQGGAGDNNARKEHIQQFFNTVAKEIHPYLYGQKQPLILAGNEAVIPFYREASNTGVIFEKPIEGVNGNIQPKQLHQKALEVLKPKWERENQEVLGRYAHASSKGSGLSNVLEIVAKAHHGKIEELLIGKPKQKWGREINGTDLFEEVSQPAPDAVDLIDYAAVKTILHGGQVYSFQDGLPDNQDQIAALVRK